MTKNFRAFLNLADPKLRNKHVVIVKGKVVGKGKDIETILRRVRKRYPKETPFVGKIPGGDILIL